jgi:hypothetical protein
LKGKLIMDKEPRVMDQREAMDRSAEPEFIVSPSRSVPELSHGERKEVSRRKNISAVVVHESIREVGERELQSYKAVFLASGTACSKNGF